MSLPNILYVDNEFQAKKRVVMLLFDSGYDVLPVSNTAEALAILRVSKFDMIITDTRLPDGDAEHLIQTIKSSPALKDLPILVYSSIDDDAAKRLSLGLGAAAFLAKDSANTLFLEVVKNVIDSHRHSERQELGGGMSGQLAKTRIGDVILKLAQEKKSGTITIDGVVPMELHMVDGALVHARHGITVGQKALFRCMLIAEAAFHFKPSHLPVEGTISGSVEDLLLEGGIANEKLMANSHKLPSVNHRVRIVHAEALPGMKLKPEARAALEIIRKHSRIGSYLDRLNLPDVVCFEYLLTFIERGIIELVTEPKPVKIIVDASADLPAEVISGMGIEVLPLTLRVGDKRYPAQADAKETESLYGQKPKVLERGQIELPEPQPLRDFFSQMVRDFDCFTLPMAASLTTLQDRIQKCFSDILSEPGPDGRTRLANELTVFNSRNMSLGLGLLAKHAARLAMAGQHVEQIEEQLLLCLGRLHVLFAVRADRSYLINKGSFYTILAWDGANYHVVNQLGKGDNPIPLLIQEVQNRIDPKAYLHFFVGHVGEPSGGEALRTQLSHSLEISKPPLLAISTISGYQLGLGALGIAFFQE